MGSATRKFKAGSYTGSGVAQSFDCDFKPGKVVIHRDETPFASVMKSEAMGLADAFVEAVGQTADLVTITADGFDIGTGDLVNKDTITYYYEATE